MKQFFLLGNFALFFLTINCFGQHLPKTPAGKRAREIVDLLNNSSSYELDDYIQNQYSPGFRDGFGIATHKAIFPRIRSGYGKVSVVDILESTQNRIKVVLKSASKDEYLNISLDVESDEPHRIVSMGVRPGGSQVSNTADAHGGTNKSQEESKKYQSTFRPATFEIEKTIQFDSSPELVFPLFAPEWRRLYDERWKPKVVFSPPGGRKEGMVLRMATPFGDGGAIVSFINRYDPEAMQMRFSILYQDVEIEKYEISCKANPHGGTEATVRINIFGLSEHGNRAVTSYVNGGGLEEVINDWRVAINEYLDKKDK